MFSDLKINKILIMYYEKFNSITYCFRSYRGVTVRVCMYARRHSVHVRFAARRSHDSDISWQRAGRHTSRLARIRRDDLSARRSCSSCRQLQLKRLHQHRAGQRLKPGFHPNAIAAVRALRLDRNRAKRKRLRWQAANHGCHCFDRASYWLTHV